MVDGNCIHVVLLILKVRDPFDKLLKHGRDTLGNALVHVKMLKHFVVLAPHLDRQKGLFDFDKLLVVHVFEIGLVHGSGLFQRVLKLSHGALDALGALRVDQLLFPDLCDKVQKGGFEIHMDCYPYVVTCVYVQKKALYSVVHMSMPMPILTQVLLLFLAVLLVLFAAVVAHTYGYTPGTHAFYVRRMVETLRRNKDLVCRYTSSEDDNATVAMAAFVRETQAAKEILRDYKRLQRLPELSDEESQALAIRLFGPPKEWTHTQCDNSDAELDYEAFLEKLVLYYDANRGFVESCLDDDACPALGGLNPFKVPAA